LEWLIKAVSCSLLLPLLSPIHPAYPLPLFMCLVGGFGKNAS
jgi:hypothetical protein